METIKVHNIETGEVIEREMTPEELADFETRQELSLQIKAEKELKAQERQALLDRLGITEEEARLLLGGK